MDATILNYKLAKQESHVVRFQRPVAKEQDVSSLFIIGVNIRTSSHSQYSFGNNNIE